MTEFVAADIGGTHARFALAAISEEGCVSLGDVTTLRTSEHATLGTAWEAFAAAVGRPMPKAAAFAVACPVAGDVLKLTNNPWTIRRSQIARELDLERLLLINDFGAVGHAVAQAGPEYFQDICGPAGDLPDQGIISIVGPGTGLGVAQVRRSGCEYEVIETEGGHIELAATDAVEDVIASRLRGRLRRVSAERVLSGPGLMEIHNALVVTAGGQDGLLDDKALWALALGNNDSLASAALERFCLMLGGFAGDIALAQGAVAVVIAGGVGRRLQDRLGQSGFARRFIAKGRFESMMSQVPVKLIIHPQPGLFGAATAFAKANVTGKLY